MSSNNAGPAEKDIVLAKLAGEMDKSITDIEDIAMRVGLLALQYPDMLGGDLYEYATNGCWQENACFSVERDTTSGENVLMAMRVLIYKLRKYEGKDGKADQIYKMMNKLGFFRTTDILR